MTVDVPGESRRERQRRAHISVPPKITPKIALSLLLHPHWSLSMAAAGYPRMKFPESYVDPSEKDKFAHAGRVIRGWPDWTYLRELRQEWQGDLIIKGVQEPEDAVKLIAEGIDAIWVSNHSGRQFEGGPASIDRLPVVRAAVGPDVPLIFDSGVAGGLDVLRALALGADFVFMGRAFHYAVAAFQDKGLDHLMHILTADMQSNMAQIGCASFDQLAERIA
jgi:L-lactate dehydrogenase (cytochrome)